MSVVATLSVSAQTFPSGFSRVLVTNGLVNPTAMAFAPDGRIFVCLQNGSLRVIKNNVLLTTPFVTIPVNATGERGLVGIALDPQFATNGYVYLYYTLQNASCNRISRFTANGDVALPGSEVVILNLDPLTSATNHNGGAMKFGSDGKLYVAIGENATPLNATNLDTYHGKVIRINKDGSVPEGNPFPGGNAQGKRVWAYGLRNPYSISFEPGTSKLYINDVGQNTWEEINDGTLGGNHFGWPVNEGVVADNPHTNPVYAYGHGSGDGVGCAITGGVFFRPPTTTYPSAYYGKYFFQDYCGQWINYITPSAGASRSSFARTIGGSPLGLDVGNDGNLYYLSRAQRSLYKIVYSSSLPPIITDQPEPQAVFEGQSATLNVSASGALPMQFQWRKNGQPIQGETGTELRITSLSAADVGQYSVEVTNNFGGVVSNVALLSLNGVNLEPLPVIALPVANSLYRAGDVISYSGNATDPEEGALPSTSLSWEIDFHHGSHVHDSPPITGVASGSFAIPVSGETSDDVWYRIRLTAEDAGGRTATVYHDILPRKSQVTLTSDPPGLSLTLDGQPVQTPHTFTGVEGIERMIGLAQPQQILDGNLYQFEEWEHGGAASQTISTPEEDVVYQAVFTEILYGPVISDQPDPQQVVSGGTATLNVVASGSQPLQYQWKKDGVAIDGATSAQLLVNNIQLTDIGRYSVSVTNRNGSLSSEEALVRIMNTNVPPVGVISLPDENTIYRPGQTITFAGSASDAEDGSLSSDGLTWEVSLRDGADEHQVYSTTGVSSGSFKIPETGAASDKSSYRITLISEDSDGGISTTHRDIHPHRSRLAIETVPGGLTLYLDGAAVKTPYVTSVVEGVMRGLAVEEVQQIKDGEIFEFSHWLHGGERSQQIKTSGQDATYTAVFQSITFAPIITDQPDPLVAEAGSIAHFSVEVSGAKPISYQWMKNGIDLPGETFPLLTITGVTPAAVGRYSLRIANQYGSVVSTAATLRITDVNVPPAPVMLSPGEGTKFRAGEAITFAGSASDPEDAQVPANNLSWLVRRKANNEVAQLPVTTGLQGTFTAIAFASDYDDVSYTITLSATDSEGKVESVSRQINPYTTAISLQTDPPGLSLQLNHKNVVAPFTFNSVVGVTHEIDLDSTQVKEAKTFVFERWQHGGRRSQSFVVPETNTTMTAIFSETTVTDVETSHKKEIVIYPNPAQDHLIIENVPRSTLSITDLTGKLLGTLNAPFPLNRLRWDLALEPGVYLLNISGARSKTVHKFLISASPQ